MVLSLDEYRRLQHGAHRTVSAAIHELRADLNDAEPASESEFAGLREASPGRDFDW